MAGRRAAVVACFSRRAGGTAAVGGALRACGTGEQDPEDDTAGETHSFDYRSNTPFDDGRAAIYHSAPSRAARIIAERSKSRSKPISSRMASGFLRNGES